MSQELATKNQTALASYNEEQRELLKQVIAKGCTDIEIGLFLIVCKSKDLNPFDRQIYAIKRNGQMTIQTGIDGFRAIADRTGTYAPGTEQFSEIEDDLQATVSVFKLIAGAWREFSATAFYSEYAQHSNPIWKKMPKTMLAKCAESKALRKGWPTQLGGIYTSEEMAQAADEPAILKDGVHKIRDKSFGFVEQSPQQNSMTIERVLAAIEAAQTEEQLAGIAALAGDLSKSDKAVARDAFRARRTSLKNDSSVVFSEQYADSAPTLPAMSEYAK